jgi:hypothetical protein
MKTDRALESLKRIRMLLIPDKKLESTDKRSKFVYRMCALPAVFWNRNDLLRLQFLLLKKVSALAGYWQYLAQFKKDFIQNLDFNVSIISQNFGLSFCFFDFFFHFFYQDPNPVPEPDPEHEP